MEKRVKSAVLIAIILLAIISAFAFLYGYRRALVIGPLIAPENITIISPSQEYYNTPDIALNISISDAVLELDMVLDGINYELCQNCYENYSLLNLPDGLHNLTITAYAASGNASKNHAFIVDTTAPGIVFENGTSENDAAVNNTIYVSVSLNEANFANITFFFFRINDSANETGGQNNETLLLNMQTFSSPVLSINYSGVMNGTYLFNVSVADKAGWVNSTETREVFLSYFCAVSWVMNSNCNSSNVNLSWYYDANFCNLNETPPNGSVSNCNYCIPNWVSQYTSCSNNEKTRYYTDGNSCYLNTGLPEDLTEGYPGNSTESCGSSSTPTPIPTTTPPMNQNQNTQNTSRNTTRISLTEAQIKSGYIVTLALNDIVEFNFSGRHVLKATSIVSNSFVLIFDANSYVLSSGTEKEFDLNGDEENDFRLKINSITSGKVSMSLGEILPVVMGNITEEVASNETIEQPIEEGLASRTFYILAGVVVGFIIISAGLVWLIIWHNNRPKKGKPKDIKKGQDIKKTK